jgi:vancomycin resistance protein YoaR
LTNQHAVFKIAPILAVMSPFRALSSVSWLDPLAVRVSLAGLVGLLLGFALVPSLPRPEDPHAAPPSLLLLGQPLPLDDAAVDTALQRVRDHVGGRFTLQLGEDARSLSFAQLGVAIDTVRLTQLVQDSRDATSPLRRTLRRNATRGPLELPVPLVLDEHVAFDVLRTLKDEHDRAPQDARIDVAAGTIVNERVGRTLDVDRTLAALQEALASGSTAVSVVFHEQHPARRAEQLAAVHFEHTLAYFETPYDRAERSRARTFNLRLAAQKLDGVVVFPGEVFDFNDVVGPRDEAHGYQVAPVIAEGEVVDGIGGGTCQISGTLHAAVFFAGLKIVERYPHTRPSSYIKLGLDAAVAYPTMNFRFQNDLPFPVVVHETVAGGTVRAEIRGPQVGPAVTLIRRVEKALPYDELERPDDRLEFGKRVLGQRGVPGFEVKRYRVVRDDEHAVRDTWRDTYPPTTQIVLVGTNRDDSDIELHGDQHPEYLADELLVLTKQRATDDEPTRYSERRDPGRFGKPQWTEQAGMPYFERK